LSRVYCHTVVQQSSSRGLLSHSVTLQSVKPGSAVVIQQQSSGASSSEGSGKRQSSGGRGASEQ